MVQLYNLLVLVLMIHEPNSRHYMYIFTALAVGQKI